MEQQLIDTVVENLKPRGVRYLFWYGSMSEDADIDLLAVLDSPEVSPYKPGKVDLLEVGKEDFVKRLFLFDPIATEAL